MMMTSHSFHYGIYNFLIEKKNKNTEEFLLTLNRANTPRDDFVFISQMLYNLLRIIINTFLKVDLYRLYVNITRRSQSQ